MLEGVASSLIAKILGDYVEAVDTQNLRFTLSGELELTNLKLKKSALSKLDLPIAVKEGFLSKLFLSVPWRSLGSQPAIIKIEKIFLLAEPATSRQVCVGQCQIAPQCARSRWNFLRRKENSFATAHWLL
jgi:vacuolar protein sorting-associated protein 13A/C